MKLVAFRKALVFTMMGLAWLMLIISPETPRISIFVAIASMPLAWRWEAPRFELERYRRPWTIATVAIFALLGTLFAAGQLELLQAMVYFVLFLSASKMFQREQNKDYIQAMALSLLMVAAATVFNLDISFGIIFIAYVLVACVALTTQHLVVEIDEVHKRSPERFVMERQLLIVTLSLSALVLAGSLAFFFIFPRVGFGFMASRERPGLQTVGFSDDVELGTHGTIQDDRSIVMRIKPAEGHGDDLSDTYWIGAALDHFDGRRWLGTRRERVSINYHEDLDIQVIGMPRSGVEVEDWVAGAAVTSIYLEPLDTDILFAPGRIRAVGFPSTIQDLPPSMSGRSLSAAVGHRVELRTRSEYGVAYQTYTLPMTRPQAELLRAAWDGVERRAVSEDELQRGQPRAHRGDGAGGRRGRRGDWRRRSAEGVVAPASANVATDTPAGGINDSEPEPTEQAPGDELNDTALSRSDGLREAFGPWRRISSELNVAWSLAYFLQLPDGGLTPRTVELIDTIIADSDTVYDQVIAIESWLKHTLGYTTDLDAPKHPDEDLIDSFLFEWQRGHCEYFASAMVVMLRSKQIPARIVNGYLGAEYNEVGDYWVVRQGMAHSWVEAFFPEVGWVSFDPTPSRESSQMSRFWNRIELVIDNMRMHWLMWVIEYDMEKQITAARSAVRAVTGGRDSVLSDEGQQNLAKFGWWLLLNLRALALLAALAFGFMFQFRKRARAMQPWQAADWSLAAAWIGLAVGVVVTLWRREPWTGYLIASLSVSLGVLIAWRLRREHLGLVTGGKRASWRRGSHELSALYLRLLVAWQRHAPDTVGPATTPATLRAITAAQRPDLSEELERFLAVYEASRFGGADSEPAQLKLEKARVRALVRALRRGPDKQG